MAPEKLLSELQGATCSLGVVESKSLKKQSKKKKSKIFTRRKYEHCYPVQDRSCPGLLEKRIRLVYRLVCGAYSYLSSLYALYRQSISLLMHFTWIKI